MTQTKTAHDSETPAHDQQVITACAFLHHDFNGIEKLFLPRRAATKKFLPSVYELPGGHIDFGEDLIEGLRREIKEEFGKDIEIGDPFAAFTYNNDVKGSHSVEIVFFARFVGDIDDIALDPADHADYQWFAEDEIDQAASAGKTIDDPEIQIMKKGFSLLRGERLQF